MIKQNIALLLSLAFVAVAAACNGASPQVAGNNSGQPSASPSSNSNSSAATPTPSPTPVVEALPGTYTLSEVHDKGIVTIISTENRTEFSFFKDGRYARMSMVGGRTDHTDGGKFRIDGQDQLVLSIEISNKSIQMPPKEKRHRFSLSPDASEMRLTAADGKVAVFKKTRSAS